MTGTTSVTQTADVTGSGGGVRALRGLAGVVRPYAGRLVWAMAAGVAAELCGLGLVAAAAWLIARAAQQPTMAALSLAIVAVRGFALGKGALRYLERLAGHDVALRALARLRGQVFDALAARGPAAAGGRVSRDLGDAQVLSGLVSDVEAVQDLLLRCVLPAVTAVVCGAAGVAVCAMAVPSAAVPLAAGLLVGVWCCRGRRGRRGRAPRRGWRGSGSGWRCVRWTCWTAPRIWRCSAPPSGSTRGRLGRRGGWSGPSGPRRAPRAWWARRGWRCRG
ncbi:ABC transporter domain-containing protein [Actinomadura keratinilytica]|uniref:hypothetical protein n=1 Tax=Actinomadura keratinilytica TaxID=547461 RepID=UPI003620CD7C